MADLTESYILFTNNHPIIHNGSYDINQDSIYAYGCWAGLVSDMVASGAAPFVRINIDGIRVTYHFTVFSLAPFNVVVDDGKLGLMALDYSVLAFGRLLNKWMSNWPWAACSILESPDAENPITKLILLSVTPSVDIIVDVPSSLIKTMLQKSIELSDTELKKPELAFVGD
jgi:hypothetical protein